MNCQCSVTQISTDYKHLYLWLWLWLSTGKGSACIPGITHMVRMWLMTHNAIIKWVCPWFFEAGSSSPLPFTASDRTLVYALI